MCLKTYALERLDYIVDNPIAPGLLFGVQVAILKEKKAAIEKR